MTTKTTSPPDVVMITDTWGETRNDRWAHAYVQAQRSEPTPAQIKRVRHLVGQIVEVMKGG